MARFCPTGQDKAAATTASRNQKPQNNRGGLAAGAFVGPDGLMMLFSLLADGSLPREEILELAKRVQIPGYELARDLSANLTSSNAVSQFLGHRCYLQLEIREMIALALYRV
jgi:hypothetical protein